jgi:zinc protease
MMRSGWLRGSVATLAGLTVLAVLTATARSAETPPSLKKITTVEGISEYRLDNGVRILLFPDASTSKVTVNCTVFVGSRHEGYGETGMAHLLEHMVFKGTRLYPRATDIPKLLKDRGAEYNGSTSDDRTNYYETLNATDENLEFAIRLEADRLVNSFIRREDLASEMTVVRSEFEMGENSPRSILLQRMMAVSFEWHNYGKNTIGNRSDIERVPIERLQAFYRKHYQPDNVMVIVAGNFKEEKALALIAKYYGALKKPERQLEETYTEEPPQDGERSVVLRRVGAVGYVGAVYHIPAAAHEDSAALDVLSQALTSQPSGRLYKALVEKGKKATAVLSGAQGLHDPGAFVVLASVDDKTTVPEARNAMLGAIELVRESKFTEEEVNRAKLQLKNDWELAMTQSNHIGVQLSEWASRGDWRLMFLHRDRVAKVTPADVSRVAKKYLTPTNRTVGMYIPTKKPERAAIPATPDITKLVQDYKGRVAVAKGESFDPTVANIEKRVQMTQLSGGVKAALLPRKTRGEVVTVNLTLHYGNAESIKGHTSATQFLATLMARGTKKHNRQQLEDELDRLQAQLKPSGLLGTVSFSIECKRKALPEVLALLAEILREPAFPENEFNILKRQQRSQLERAKPDPIQQAVRALQRKLAPYPPEDVRYVPSIEESLARLDAVTVEEVRKLYTEQLGGQNGEFVVVGDFDPALVLKQMEDALKDWKPGVECQRVAKPAPENIKPERIAIDTPDKENAFYVAAMVFPLKDTDPDNAALEVANFLLGGGSLSSRLGNRVRQKEGLSYGVQSQYSADARDKFARFLMAAICNPKNIDKVDKAMLEEVNKLGKEGVTETELRESKKAYLASLKQSRASDAGLATILQSELHVGRSIAYYGELEKKIAALTVEEVNSAFRHHIDPKKLVIVRAGDFTKK